MRSAVAARSLGRSGQGTLKIILALVLGVPLCAYVFYQLTESSKVAPDNPKIKSDQKIISINSAPIGSQQLADQFKPSAGGPAVHELKVKVQDANGNTSEQTMRAYGSIETMRANFGAKK